AVQLGQRPRCTKRPGRRRSFGDPEVVRAAVAALAVGSKVDAQSRRAHERRSVGGGRRELAHRTGTGKLRARAIRARGEEDLLDAVARCNDKEQTRIRRRKSRAPERSTKREPGELLQRAKVAELAARRRGRLGFGSRRLRLLHARWLGRWLRCWRRGGRAAGIRRSARADRHAVTTGGGVSAWCFRRRRGRGPG